MEITIKQATTAEDLKQILFIQEETWKTTYPNEERDILVSDIEKHFEERKKDGWFEKRLKNISGEKFINYLAFTDKTAVGWIGCFKDENNIASFGLYIIKNYQNKGVGQLLLNKALPWLLDSNKLEIGVAEYNENAIKFYLKNNFKFIEETEEILLKSGKKFLCKKMIYQ